MLLRSKVLADLNWKKVDNLGNYVNDNFTDTTIILHNDQRKIHSGWIGNFTLYYLPETTRLRMVVKDTEELYRAIKLLDSISSGGGSVSFEEVKCLFGSSGFSHGKLTIDEFTRGPFDVLYYKEEEGFTLMIYYQKQSLVLLGMTTITKDAVGLILDYLLWYENRNNK